MRTARLFLASALLWAIGCTPVPVALPTPTAAPTAPPTPHVRPAPTPVAPTPVVSSPRTVTLSQPVPTPRSTTPPVVVHVPPLGSLLSGALPAADADYGLVVQDVASGARVTMNDRRVFPSASLYKLAVAWEVLHRADDGAMNLDDPLQITDDDAVEPEPYGGVAPGQAPSLREALAAMLTVSSNAAAHALLRVLGRHDFNAAMGQLGLGDTRVPEDSAADDQQSDAQAVTSAADMAHLLSLIAHNQTLTTGSHDDLMHLMASGGPPDALRDTLPDSVDVYDKTGNLPDASNVTALLQSGHGMVVLVVLDQGVNPGEARGVIAQLGQAAYEAVLR